MGHRTGPWTRSVVTSVPYVPKRGDLVWLSFSPQAGHEPAVRQPAVVVSPSSYNRRVGLALFCPITRQAKQYPFEVALPVGIGVEGVIFADEVKSLDWRVREAEFIGQLPETSLIRVIPLSQRWSIKDNPEELRKRGRPSD